MRPKITGSVVRTALVLAMVPAGAAAAGVVPPVVDAAHAGALEATGDPKSSEQRTGADRGSGEEQESRERQEAREEKQEVEQELAEAAEDLDESSAELQAATAALRTAETDLARARGQLAYAQGEVAAARARDREAAARLAAAERAVERTTRELEAVRRRLAEQRRVVGTFAAATYRQGGLLDLASVLSAGSAVDLGERTYLMARVDARQQAAVDGLRAARAAITARREVLAKARRAAAERRQETREQLAHTRTLEARTAAAHAAVERLVAERQRLLDDAEQAKRADEKRYDELVAERARIEAMLREIARREAEEARRRAEEEARRREAERRAAEQREAERRAAEQRRRRQRTERSGRTDDTPDAGTERRGTRKERSGGSSGRSVSSRGLARPVGGALTSSYGRRFHPILRRWKLHDGTDFGAACGTPVRAAASGRVTSRYYNSGYGNRVIISHGWRNGASLATSYNHLSRFAVRVGERVSRGEVIGYVGTTGYSTGCHLHFMVYRNGRTVNPMGYL